MPHHYLLAMTNALPGQDVEFNRWYDERHLSDVMNVPGVVRALRLQAIDGLRGPLSWNYVTLYELDTEDPAGLLQELSSRAGTDLMPLTSAMDLGTAGAAILQAIGGVHPKPEHTAEQENHP
jgi:hypothetical protein